MSRQSSIFLIAVLGLGLSLQQAHALPARLGLGPKAGLPQGGQLIDGRFTVAPAAFAEYCANYAAQCRNSGSGSVMALDDARWEELQSVNSTVNHSITPQADPVGEDHWTLDTDHGDCDDYAVTKRKALLDRGWPSGALALTAAYLQKGVGHLVLVVRTDRGEFVLDNLRDTVFSADRVHYRWVARQSTIHPMLWVKVNGSRRDSVQMVKSEPAESAPLVQQAMIRPNSD